MKKVSERTYKKVMKTLLDEKAVKILNECFPKEKGKCQLKK